ncbi:MAG: tetratricopeptide repeat protein [Sphingobacteriaceae bacterium]|nr:tetratricopeptide repeat protein [Sphingobacteriaceae bacterium]
MQYLRFPIFILFFILPFSFIKAQEQTIIEKLTKEIATAKEDTNRIKKLDKLTWNLLSNGEFETAKKYILETKELSDKLHFKRGQIYYHNNLGLYYYYQSNFPQALEEGLLSLKVCEELADTARALDCFGNIGNIYADLNQNDKALEFYNKGLVICERKGYTSTSGSFYINIGSVLDKKEDYPNALTYYFKGLDIFIKAGNEAYSALCYNNIGQAYGNLRLHDEALKYFLKATEIQLRIDNKEGISTSYLNIASLHNHLKDLKKALEYAELGLNTAIEIGYTDNIRLGYESMADIHYHLGHFKEAYDYQGKFKKLNDSIYNVENSNQLSDLKTDFEVQKKSIELEAKSIAEKKTRDTIIYSVCAGLFLVLVFSFFLFKRFKVTQRQKKLIEVQKAEVERQKQIAEEQRNIVEEKQKEVMDSIRYARRIQQSLLPTEKYIERNLDNLKKG